MCELPQYPINLLPSSHKCKFCCSLDEYYLIRFSPPNVKLIDELDGRLNVKAIGTPSSTHMPDLSTSLFGIFDIKHTKIEILNKNLNEYCAPNLQVDSPIYLSDFNYNENRGFWFIRIFDINGKGIECTHNNITIKATCTIEHTPTKCNFWHFSIRWYIINFHENWHKLEVRGNNWWDKLAHSARIFIKGFGITVIPEKISINDDCYTTPNLIN